MHFEQFVAEQGPSLLRLATVLAGDHHRAEDLTQSALATAYRRWNRVVTARDPAAYVRRILINEYLGWRRRRWTWERPVDTGDLQHGCGPDPACAVDERDELRLLLSRLSPRARTVLVLRYYLDLDDAAVAEALGISPSGVRATASRALAGLRSSLATHTERTPS